MKKTLIKKEIEVWCGLIQYHEFYPRFLVHIEFDDNREGSVEVTAECERGFGGFINNKEECREELEKMTIEEVKEVALSKVAREEWLNKPSYK